VPAAPPPGEGSRDQFDVFERGVSVVVLAQRSPRARALHVDSHCAAALTAAVGKDLGPGKLQTLETVKHHLKPERGHLSDSD
jgi:hypothetical protein